MANTRRWRWSLELHHFGWNARSSAFAYAGHHTEGPERRYLLPPGLRSSNVTPPA
nr:selenium-binding protein SBP56-related protein [Actinomadura geliboluensis]